MREKRRPPVPRGARRTASLLTLHAFLLQAQAATPDAEGCTKQWCACSSSPMGRCAVTSGQAHFHGSSVRSNSKALAACFDVWGVVCYGCQWPRSVGKRLQCCAMRVGFNTINKPPPLNRDYNRDPNIKALKRKVVY